MDVEVFESSLGSGGEPPAELGDELKALWHDAKGDWEKAHELCQSAGSREGDWVHAYLHRVEGDLSNASYWYHRSGQPECEGSLKEEWRSIVQKLLSR